VTISFEVLTSETPFNWLAVAICFVDGKAPDLEFVKLTVISPRGAVPAALGTPNVSQRAITKNREVIVA
jgi:hypothetical protein